MHISGPRTISNPDVLSTALDRRAQLTQLGSHFRHYYYHLKLIPTGVPCLW